MSERREPGIPDTIGHSLLGGLPASRRSFLSSERGPSGPARSAESGKHE
jgi:hypothetical protein